jgi:hypothetical protein
MTGGRGRGRGGGATPASQDGRQHEHVEENSEVNTPENIPERTFAIKNISPPANLDVKKPDVKTAWPKWKKAWKRYLLLSGIHTQSKEFIANLLLHTMGPDAEEVFDGFAFENDNDADDPDVVLQKFDEYFVGASRDFIERMKFFRRKQQAGETFEQFLNELRNMSKSCGFCDCMLDIMIMDRIIDGHKSQDVKEKLIAQDKVDLKTVVNICRAMELTDENLKVVTNASHDPTEEVKKVQASKGKYKRHRDTIPHQKSQRRKFEDSHQKVKTCKFCGGEHVFKKASCPAWGKTCKECRGENHFANVCPKKVPKKSRQSKFKKPQKNVNAVCTDYSSEDEYYSDSTEGSINTVIVSAVNDKNKPLYAKMIIDDKPVVHQIDPGATACIIPASYVGDRTISEESVTLRLYDNSQIKALGRCKIKVKNAKTGKKWNISYVVISDESLTPLLSRQAAELMNLITVNYDNFVSSVDSSSQSSDLKSLVKSHPDVFSEGLGRLPGSKVHLTVAEDARPVVKPARNIPEARKMAVKTELKRMENEGIIQKVDQPSDWVSQMAVVDKKDGSVRICLDPRSLNEVLKREHFKLPVLDAILPELSGATLFSVFDLRQGYLHLELDDESCLLTTFATPFGRYCWNRLPYGLNISSEIFQKRLCQALEGLKGVWCVADDIIIAGKDKLDHSQKTLALLQRCAEVGIRLNSEKCQHEVSEVKFLGHIVSADGLKPDPAKVSAITDMPVPDGKDAVERLKGMVAYLSRFLPKLSSVMEPINQLTRKDVDFCWENIHDKAFSQIKHLVMNAPVLRYFDPMKSVVIQCDASSKGLGAVMLQDDHPIAYGSRTLTDTETRYSVMEKEMLAIVFSLEKWHQYTYGRPITVQSDHKPLETITKKPLDQAPRRLQMMLLRALAYNVNVQYVKGKKMVLADALSRASIPHDSSDNSNDSACIHATNAFVTETQLEEIRNATQNDKLLQNLKQVILHGWPDHRVPDDIGSFRSMKDQLAVEDGIIMKGCKIVVPQAMKKRVIELLHIGHQGVDGCLRHAREYFYWPGLATDISSHISKCQTCQENGQRQQKETLQPHSIPDLPWQKVGVDLFSVGEKTYLVTVCYHSNFFEIDRLYQTGARTVINKLKTHCARYGIPTEIVSDCGPQFTSDDFAKFVKQWCIKHTKSSPHYPKSNGKAESAVKTAKKIVKSQDPFLALLNVRNTPQQGIELSPAQRLFSRRTRTLLPLRERMLEFQAIDKKKLRANIDKKQRKEKTLYDKHAKDLKPLKLGDLVRIQPNKIGDRCWLRGTVCGLKGYRSYDVKTQSGNVVRRNRSHLKVVPSPRPQQELPEAVMHAPKSAPKTVVNPPEETRRSKRLRKTPLFLEEYECK